VLLSLKISLLRGWKSMPQWKLDVYVDENYLKTLYVEAEDQYAAEEKARKLLEIDFDSELADA
jgi:hypothetical protein